MGPTALGATTVMSVGGVGFLWIVAYVAFVPSLRGLGAPTAVETLPHQRDRTPADAVAGDSGE